MKRIGVMAVCLLAAASLTLGKDKSTTLTLPKGARVGVIDMLDPEIAHFHTSRVLTQSFLKTYTVTWPIEGLLQDALTQPLAQLGLVAVPLGASDALNHDRDELFVNNSVAKGLPRSAATELAQVAAAEHLDALILLLPALNNSAQAAGADRPKTLPEYLRGWCLVTKAEGAEKPSLYNITQLLLIGVTPEGATLGAREWGGSYSADWPSFAAPPDLKHLPDSQLAELQPLFAHILKRQASHLLESVVVLP